MALNEFARDDDALIPVATPIDGPVERRIPPNPMLLETIPRSRAAAHLAILVAAYIFMLVVVIVAYQISNGWDVNEAELTSSAAPIAITVAVGLTLVALAVGLMWRSSCSAASIGLSFSRWHVDCLWGVLVALVSFGAHFAVIGLIYVASPESIKQMESNPQRITEMLPPMHPAALAVMMSLVALWEEAIFRGVLVTHLRRMLGTWSLAILIAAGLFGVMHLGAQEPIMAIPLAVLGIIWTLFMLWRRSIVAGVVGHALFNLGQLFMIYHMSKSLPGPDLVA
jgi:membrane protease YdiL (CAAX protease family)